MQQEEESNLVFVRTRAVLIADAREDLSVAAQIDAIGPSSAPDVANMGYTVVRVL